MIKTIVTTTISEPTEATLKFCEIAKRDDWIFIIVGDKKTPHHLYADLVRIYSGNVLYLHPDAQERMWPDLSNAIGWNSIQRRNFGFIHAVKNLNADIIATIDDDNIPYDNWPGELYVNKEVSVVEYLCHGDVFDPLSPLVADIWHRGYPIQMLDSRINIKLGIASRIKVGVQVNLWNGHPDIDAVCRISNPRMYSFSNWNFPYFSRKLTMFNSQNTILPRYVFPDYWVMPFVGRMDDIWPSYYVQRKLGIKPVFFAPTVTQIRHEHNVVDDLRKEIIGYEKTYLLIQDMLKTDYDAIYRYISAETMNTWNHYRKAFV